MLQVKSLNLNKSHAPLKNVFESICNKNDSGLQCTLGYDYICERSFDKNKLNKAK